MLRSFAIWAAFIILTTGCATNLLVRVPESPVGSVFLSQSQIQPGHAIRITAQVCAPGTTLSAQGWGQTVALVPVPGFPGQRECFLAIPLETNPGPAEVAITIVGSGQMQTLSEPVEVLPREPYPTVHLKIKGFSQLPYSVESRAMAKIRRQTGNYPGPRLEPWDWPVNGRLSERFGVWRVYNKGLGSWYHGGYDIAAPGGTSILAPANGRVVFTAPFKAHGNTILIDHGYGVITTYLHLRTIYVQAGEWVRQEQAIGEVGSTGGATADHLHFQINVNGQVTDPADFLKARQEQK